MSKPKRTISTEQPDALFGRVVSILEQARGNVVRAVNTNMVLAYWLIGREIVQELQGGEERAEYGKKVVEELSARLTERYGKGFSSPVLWSYRQFYLVYAGRDKILFPAGRESTLAGNLSPTGRELATIPIQHTAGGEAPRGFSPQLTWSHYRALMRVENVAARDFYEQEASECGWSKAQLERQIHSFYYDRIVANRGEKGLLLCSDKSEAVAKYSILNESKQIFASKYLPNLPTEEQLRREIERERHLIESALEDRSSE